MICVMCIHVDGSSGRGLVLAAGEVHVRGANIEVRNKVK